MGRNEMSSLVEQKNLQELLVFLHSVSHGCLCQPERQRDILKLSGCEQAIIWNNHNGFINKPVPEVPYTATDKEKM